MHCAPFWATYDMPWFPRTRPSSLLFASSLSHSLSTRPTLLTLANNPSPSLGRPPVLASAVLLQTTADRRATDADGGADLLGFQAGLCDSRRDKFRY